jgi:hypothetical protein
LKRRAHMKKNKTKGQEQKRKPRRLSLNRETILVLNDPALLELARGGTGYNSHLNTDCPTTGRTSATIPEEP